MPYRRRYGRRRRYSRRRRAVASRAVPRTTFAPRHQYLKLRMSVAGTSVGNGINDANLRFTLDRMKKNFYETGQFAKESLQPLYPLGYTEYGSIFSQYVVHGVKFDITFSCLSSTTSGFSVTVGYAYHTVPAIVDPAEFPGTAAGYASYPLGGLFVVTHARPYRFKRYMSNSKIAGRKVNLFNNYIKDWETGTVTNPSELMLDMRVPVHPSGTIVNCQGTMTFYVSAVSVKEDIGLPGAFAAVSELTEPGPAPIGEPVESTIAHTQAINTGVASNKRTLKDLNLGGK